MTVWLSPRGMLVTWPDCPNKQATILSCVLHDLLRFGGLRLDQKQPDQTASWFADHVNKSQFGHAVTILRLILNSFSWTFGTWTHTTQPYSFIVRLSVSVHLAHGFLILIWLYKHGCGCCHCDAKTFLNFSRSKPQSFFPPLSLAVYNCKNVASNSQGTSDSGQIVKQKWKFTYSIMSSCSTFRNISDSVSWKGFP